MADVPGDFYRRSIAKDQNLERGGVTKSTLLAQRASKPMLPDSHGGDLG